MHRLLIIANNWEVVNNSEGSLRDGKLILDKARGKTDIEKIISC